MCMEDNVEIKKHMLYFLLAYITLLGLKIDIFYLEPERNAIVQLLDAASGFSMNDIIMLTGMTFFYKFSFAYLKNSVLNFRNTACVAGPAFLFAVFMVSGRAFA